METPSIDSHNDSSCRRMLIKQTNNESGLGLGDCHNDDGDAKAETDYGISVMSCDFTTNVHQFIHWPIQLAKLSSAVLVAMAHRL